MTAALARLGGGLVVALGDDGFRVPIPDAPDLAGLDTVPVPAERATMVDLVVPSDAMTVITTWERAVAQGAATDTVHLKSDPDHRVRLVIADARDRYGVWLGMLGEPESEQERVETPLDPSLLVPRRPRIGTIRKDWHAVITRVDDHALGMLGWTAEEMLGQRSLEFIHPEDQDRAVVNWMEMLSHGQLKRIRLRHRRSDASWLWVEAENLVVGSDDEGMPQIDTRLSDISDEMAAHEEVRRREALFRRLAESLPTGIMQIDRNRTVVYANSHLSAVLGVDSAATLTQQLRHLRPEDRARLESAVAAALADRTDEELEVDLWLPGTGESRHCTAAVVAMAGPEGSAEALVWVHDVTESTRMRQELLHRATHDPLTGCLNRAAILAALDDALAGSAQECTAVFYLDLNRFKHINDTLGHAAGDELLVRVAQRLTGLSGDGDHVGRLGGDEFLVVCTRLQHRDRALEIAEEIRAAFGVPVTLTTGTITVEAGIGVAVGRNGTPAGELVALADAAMYRSKQRGHVVLGSGPSARAGAGRSAPVPGPRRPATAPHEV